MNPQELIYNTEQTNWDKENLMNKFYPSVVETPTKPKKAIRGFKMVYKKPSSPTAEAIIKNIEEEGVGIKQPLFEDRPRDFFGFLRRFWK